MKKNSKPATTPAEAPTAAPAAMQAVYRYKFATVQGDQVKASPQAVFMMPEGATVVSIGFSLSSGPYILALVNPDATDEQMEPRTFRLIPTGEKIEAGAKYITSLARFHLFEIL